MRKLINNIQDFIAVNFIYSYYVSDDHMAYKHDLYIKCGKLCIYMQWKPVKSKQDNYNYTLIKLNWL